MASSVGGSGAKRTGLLARHPLIRTADVDDARAQVSRVFCAHRLSTVLPGGRLNLQHNRAELGSLSLHYVDYGAPVRITPGELTSFYLVQLPLSGVAEIRCGRATIASTPDLAAVPNPTEDLDMEWGADNPHLVIHIPRVHVEASMQALLGTTPRVPVRFDLGMDMRATPGKRWRALLAVLLGDAELPTPQLHPAVQAQLEDLLVLELLCGHPNNYTASLPNSREPYAPRTIRAAMALCDTAGDRPVTVSGLAAAAGVSIRALQDGFRRYSGMTPMGYLRDVRLRRVREELLTTSSAPIADIARRWGFAHPGRFSRAYRERFGELPSQTRQH